LPAVNYNKSLGFFKALGFDIAEHDRYAVMRLGSTYLHLQATTDRAQSENAVCFLYVDNVDVFYSIAVARGGRAVMQPRDNEFDSRECAVMDPSGILLRIRTPRKKKGHKAP